MPAFGQQALLLLSEGLAFFEGVQPFGTAGIPSAAKVHVAFSDDSVCVQARDSLHGVVAEELVVVPGVAVGVHEDEDGREGVVVRYDVGEVGHYFVAFVFGGREGRVRGSVDGVDGEGVRGEVGLEPGGVVGGGVWNDEDAGVVGVGELGVAWWTGLKG